MDVSEIKPNEQGQVTLKELIEVLCYITKMFRGTECQ